MWLVNRSSPPPTHHQVTSRCTRYCHDRACPHFASQSQILRFAPYFKEMVILYRKNIEILGSLPGLTYKQANILIYVIAFPVFWISILCIIVRQRMKIRKLKKKMAEEQHVS